MMKTKIENIWSELEQDKSFNNGLLFRRYSALVKADILIGISGQQKSRFIAVGYDKNLQVNTAGFQKLKDIKVEIIADPNNSKRTLLTLTLTNNLLTDIFSVLCEDLIVSLQDKDDEKYLLREILNRLEKWQALFEKLNPEGLPPEAQRGLFGELYLLRKLCTVKENNLLVMRSWVGSSPELQDFQGEGWAVEVKTTSGNNHQRLFISNERQLDESTCGKLFLYHLSLDVRKGAEESLNAIVESVKNIVQNDYAAYSLFCQKLVQGGYFDQHRDNYEEKKYSVRDENSFRVEGNFPRLKEKDIPNGVGDVTYSVNLSDCFDYTLTENQLINQIKYNG